MVLELNFTDFEDKFPPSSRGIILINLFLFSRGYMDHVSIIMAGSMMVTRKQSLFCFTTGFLGLYFGSEMIQAIK